MEMIRILSDLLTHLQTDRTKLKRQLAERNEQAAVVAELLRQAIEVHEAESDEDDEDDEAPEDLKGVLQTMGEDFRDFLAKVHTTSEEEDDHDED